MIETASLGDDLHILTGVTPSSTKPPWNDQDGTAQGQSGHVDRNDTIEHKGMGRLLKGSTIINI